MYDGTFKFVQDIKVGDKVVDVNFEFATVSKIIQGEQGNGNPTVTIKKSNTEIRRNCASKLEQCIIYKRRRL